MDRARSFFIVCLGILCSVATYQLGATSAKAQAPSGIRVLAGNSFVLSGGTVYRLDTTSGWFVVAELPPVPPTDLMYYDGWTAVTVQGEGWHCDSPGQTSWRSLGMVPGGPTPAQGMSIGQLKAKYATPAQGK